jgi:pimeloyl-ACP methyl ester carboxylesterase
VSSTETEARTPAETSRGRFHRQGAGEPMLCIHGITDTWRTWELVLPALAEHHDVLAITLFGHSGGGAPDPSGDVTLKDLVDEAERDMDAAGFETAHIVGNSLGGWVAFELAARGRARSVVALSPAGGWDIGNRRALRAYWELILTQRFLKLAEPVAVNLATRPRGRRLVLGNLVSDPPSVPAGLATALVRGAADCPAALPLLTESRRDGYPDLEGIECPVRIAWGTKDRLLPVKKLSERLRRLFPDAEWVDIEGAGHLPQIDHPERTAELILEVSTVAAPSA